MARVELYLWLWQDQAFAVHALSPTSHIVFGQIAIPDNPSSHHQTRDNGIDAAGFLPKPLWDWLAEYWEQTPILILDKSLPRKWHILTWERLNWRGQKLGQLLQVIRYAQPQTFDSLFPPIGKYLVWDQWPGGEFEPVLTQLVGERRIKREQIERDVDSGRDLGHFDRLVIIAHGGESETACLLDKSGDAWSPALPATLPREVLILACASYHGNFHELAVRCLERGAHAVICGHGPLNAHNMADFLNAWLDNNAATRHKSYELLWALQAQANPNEQGGLHWLRYYGAVFLKEYDRLTLDYFRLPERPNPVDALSQKINDDNRPDILSLLQELKDTTNIWPITQYWLLPMGLYWAEKFNHAALGSLKIRFDQLRVRCDEMTPERTYGMAAIYRRSGKYPLAIAQLAEGLQSNPDPHQEIKLLGSLLNDLIDLNLPRPGQIILDHLDNCLAVADDERQAFRLLDRRARLALRQGKFEVARLFWQTKQQQVIDLKKDDIRELACLLFISAWSAAPEADRLAEEALKRLSPNPDFGGGNDDSAYLLRALAVWQWRRHPERDVVAAFLPVCKERMTRQDPGPFAYVLLCHDLATGSQDIEQSAVKALEDKAYWLELAAFHALTNHLTETERTLSQFQKNRKNALQYLTTASLYNIDWKVELEKQQRLECDLLLAGNVSAECLLSNGLLPL